MRATKTGYLKYYEDKLLEILKKSAADSPKGEEEAPGYTLAFLMKVVDAIVRNLDVSASNVRIVVTDTLPGKNKQIELGMVTPLLELVFFNFFRHHAYIACDFRGKLASRSDGALVFTAKSV